MVPSPLLGGDSIYTLYHSPPKAKAYFPRFLGKPKSLSCVLTPTIMNFFRGRVWTHNPVLWCKYKGYTHISLDQCHLFSSVIYLKKIDCYFDLMIKAIIRSRRHRLKFFIKKKRLYNFINVYPKNYDENNQIAQNYSQSIIQVSSFFIYIVISKTFFFLRK